MKSDSERLESSVRTLMRVVCPNVTGPLPLDALPHMVLALAAVMKVKDHAQLVAIESRIRDMIG